MVYWNHDDSETRWVSEFEGGTADAAFTGDIDHINLSYAWQDFDEAVLFMRAASSPWTPNPSPRCRGLAGSCAVRSCAHRIASCDCR